MPQKKADTISPAPEPIAVRRLGVTPNALPRVTRRAQARLGLLMVIPVMALVLVFFVFPFFSAVYYSLVDFDGINPNPPFVGLDNYRRMFTDSETWHALSNNFIWIVIGTISPIVIGLVISVLIWSAKGPTTVYRLAFFLPYVLPGVAIGIVWGWIYDPLNGWLNKVLEWLGLGNLARGWLGDPNTALYAVLGTAIWAATGFSIVIFVSALRNVDIDLVDAAKIDGANWTRRLVNVIVPQIFPVFIMVLTLTLVGGFSVFDIVFIMTGGGPADASNVLGTYAYKQAFNLNRISYGTTLALFITVLSVPAAMIMQRLQLRVAQGVEG